VKLAPKELCSRHWSRWIWVAKSQHALEIIWTPHLRLWFLLDKGTSNIVTFYAYNTQPAAISRRRWGQRFLWEQTHVQ
jgi:hypothetical protein